MATVDKQIRALYRIWWLSRFGTTKDRRWRYRIYQNQEHLDLARETNKYTVEVFTGNFHDFGGQEWEPITLEPSR